MIRRDVDISNFGLPLLSLHRYLVYVLYVDRGSPDLISYVKDQPFRQLILFLGLLNTL